MEQNKNFLTLEDLVKMSDENYTKLLKENKITNILKGIGLFSDQSIKNTVLILTQSPEATCVKRMDDWNFYKRSVKKSEKSIKVISHFIAKNEKDYTDEYGNTFTKTEEKLSMKVGHVFDISQTEGKNFAYGNTNKETICTHFDSAKKALEETIKDFAISYEDVQDNGTIDFENHKIVIKNGMTLEDTLSELIKQVSRALIATRTRDGFIGLTDKEVGSMPLIETDCVEYAVKSKLGLELPDVDYFKKIATWDENQQNAFKENLNIVRSVSHQVLSNFESAIERSIRELDKKMKEQEQPETEPIEEQKVQAQPAENTKKSKTKSKTSEVQQC